MAKRSKDRVCPYCNIQLSNLWRMFPPCRQEVTYMPQDVRDSKRKELIDGGCLSLTGEWDKALMAVGILN